MTPNELYNSPVQDESYHIGELNGCYYRHVPEFEFGELREIPSEVNQRVKMKIHARHDWDYRRYWQVASVWIDEFPVMVVKNAGREGDDHHGRYVTNVEKYTEMVAYLCSLLPARERIEKDFKDADEDIPEMTNFYGGNYEWCRNGLMEYY